MAGGVGTQHAVLLVGLEGSKWWVKVGEDLRQKEKSKSLRTAQNNVSISLLTGHLLSVACLPKARECLLEVGMLNRGTLRLSYEPPNWAFSGGLSWTLRVHIKTSDVKKLSSC